ncbi:MAG: lipid A export permease/ATP-binding protein MsbA [Candidatus Thioglobus sp.]|nr:lipid A export permease/ATP-binding protein MsbA [Candidatus Thioglobus sp.]
MSYKHFFSRLFAYLKVHIAKLVFTSVLMVAATALESSIPEITGQIIDKLFTETSSQQVALFYALALLLIMATSSIIATISVAISSWVSNKVITSLRIDMFAKLLKLPRAYFDQNPTGKILSKLTYDVEQIASAASSIWLDFVKSSMTMIILTGYLFYKNWQLSLALIVLLPLIILAVKVSSKRMRKSSKKVQESMAKMTHLLDENISGNSLVKIYQAQKQETNKFNNLVKIIRQQRYKVDVTGSFNSSFVHISIGVSLAVVVYSSSTFLQMSAGEFLSFFTAMAILVQPAKKLVNINKTLQISVAAGESVFKLLDEKEENNQGKKQLKNVKGEIEFKNICFAYGQNNLVLDNINLSVKAGETVALVGSTGSGKTTIIQLLAKFYSPNSGSISIDGVDISEFEIDSLRSQIAFVDQNIRLFNDTVRGNIALGQVDNMSDEQISNAAKVSNAYEFILRLSEQFETEIGEDGTKLSGGQRQRLAIARAIAKDSPILILDEATSALDSATEKQVQTAIDAMQKNRTTIIIAHRLSTIQKADRIVVLQRGKIIEQGSHQELLEQQGEYSQLYQHQFK